MNFDFDGRPGINRERILTESEKNIAEEISAEDSSELEIAQIFESVLDVAIFGQEILNELKDHISNTLDVPKTAPQVRAAIMRVDPTIPEGAHITFSLFTQCIDELLKARRINKKDLIQFVGDPNLDTQNYEILQRRNISDDLTVVDLFLAGAVIPASYVASRMVAMHLVGPIPVLAPLIGEAIAFLFLLGLDRLAVKAQLKDSGLTTQVNGMDIDDYVDFLADNPAEIHKVLKDSNYIDSNRIEDCRMIRIVILKEHWK